ncbi:hypothetical protein FA95DRAFT_614749 [Auriscalpium vulgare]|uniref:Uncharacterized protein n=1 Tax=Auriscalpium vulgare TaxID=40419 RepID=A0ACB8REU4_9AGAM|nr:hypothetical protein FA95DRAFT_614749 [Auriscalpium vulgare]
MTLKPSLPHTTRTSPRAPYSQVRAGGVIPTQRSYLCTRSWARPGHVVLSGCTGDYPPILSAAARVTQGPIRAEVRPLTALELQRRGHTDRRRHAATLRTRVKLRAPRAVAIPTATGETPPTGQMRPQVTAPPCWRNDCLPVGKTATETAALRAYQAECMLSASAELQASSKYWSIKCAQQSFRARPTSSVKTRDGGVLVFKGILLGLLRSFDQSQDAALVPRMPALWDTLDLTHS